jgi:hypothetical protein
VLRTVGLLSEPLLSVELFLSTGAEIGTNYLREGAYLKAIRLFQEANDRFALFDARLGEVWMNSTTRNGPQTELFRGRWTRSK